MAVVVKWRQNLITFVVCRNTYCCQVTSVLHELSLYCADIHTDRWHRKEYAASLIHRVIVSWFSCWCFKVVWRRKRRIYLSSKQTIQLYKNRNTPTGCHGRYKLINGHLWNYTWISNITERVVQSAKNKDASCYTYIYISLLFKWH